MSSEPTATPSSAPGAEQKAGKDDGHAVPPADAGSEYVSAKNMAATMIQVRLRALIRRRWSCLFTNIHCRKITEVIAREGNSKA